MCSKMDDSAEKREKVTSTNRRNNKPLMEKRRRQRINDCLVQLKGLVLQALNKDTTQYSKLEKADILEMTVKHLKMVQRQQMSGIATDPNAISKYRAGFNDCASEIARYLDTVNGGNPQLKARVMNYLGNSLLQFPVIPVYQGVVSPYQVQMTSPVTSQCYPSTGYPPITPSGVVTSPYPHQYPVPSHISSCDVYKSLPQTNSPIKVEPSDIGVISPRSSSHTTSPERRVPSPCDSDSGLSDISTTVPQDENGNYTHFTGSSQQSRLDNESQNYAHVQSTDSRKRSYSDERTSPKRKEFPYESCPPKKRVKCENNANSEIKPEPPRDVPAHDPMWRPW